MADKLSIFNEVLVAHLGQSKLASLDEPIEAQRVLTQLWDSTLNYCIERGFWLFCMKTVLMAAETDLEPEFGPAYAFVLPADYKRLYQLSTDPTFTTFFNAYQIEQGRIVADVEELFLRYVSSELAAELAAWPATFTDYVTVRLARLAAKKITQADSLVEDLKSDEKRALAVARSNEAMQEPVRALPLNTWVRARSGYAPISPSREQA